MPLNPFNGVPAFDAHQHILDPFLCLWFTFKYVCPFLVTHPHTNNQLDPYRRLTTKQQRHNVLLNVLNVNNVTQRVGPKLNRFVTTTEVG